MATLAQIEAEIVATLKTVSALTHVSGSEPLGVITSFPYAYIRWLGPAPIDAETGGGQDVTHAWRLELGVAITPQREEEAQLELQVIAQAVTAAFRATPKLGSLVDQVRLRVESDAEYYRRASLTGEAQGAPVYGLAFRLEADLTEY